MRGILALIVTFIISAQLFGAIVHDTLYINRGMLTPLVGVDFAFFAYNDSPVFNPENERIHIEQGDSLYLTVINNDTIVHGTAVSETSATPVILNAGDTATLGLYFANLGMAIVYDQSDYPSQFFMGLGAMIVVDNSSAAGFYWNIKEHQSKWNDSVANGYTVAWGDYYPDYFTINGKSNPWINQDPNARVVGNVGDTLHIYIANTGLAVHSLHFHGYHAKIIYSSKNSNHVGRLKDTFPLYSRESMILELVPDKPGEYPVHDHNLVAVSGGNIYPNGMFLTMLIQ